MPVSLQVLHEQPFGPLHGDRNAVSVTRELPDELVESRDVVTDSQLELLPALVVHDAELVPRARPGRSQRT